MKISRRKSDLILSSLTVVLLACGASPEIASPEELELGELKQAITIPGKGTTTTLDFGSWNLEWFGDTGNGPANESLQLANARDVILGSNLDIWAFAEIVSQNHWNNLESQLTGYAGFLAKEPNVTNGAASYGTNEQTVGILYKSSLATVQSARVILTANDADFAGRPPLEVTLRVTLNGTTEDVIVIVLHAKCCSDTTGWQRRRNAALALKSYLDTSHAARKVWVLGDFNDDVDTSHHAGASLAVRELRGGHRGLPFPHPGAVDCRHLVDGRLSGHD